MAADFITDTDIALELRRLKDELLGIRCRHQLLAIDATRVAVGLSMLAEQLDPSANGDNAASTPRSVPDRLPGV